MSTVRLIARGSGQHPAVIGVSGDVDMPDAGTITEAVADALSDGVKTIVVDLSEVTFLGSIGLSDLVASRRLALAKGVSLMLRGVPRTVLRVMELTNLTPLFDITD